ncbi:MAG: DNA alkylation repair protein, partial [Candidatus Limnocylindrales bacterium]
MTRPSATDRAARSARDRRSRAVVASRLPAARALGRRLGAHLTDPEGFERLLDRGLRQLADPGLRARQARRAPGVRGLLGVRQPLLAAIARQVGRPLDGASPALALYLADRLTRSADHEARLLAVAILGHSLRADPERSWQLVRRMSRATADRMTVDTLAGLVASGV